MDFEKKFKEDFKRETAKNLNQDEAKKEYGTTNSFFRDGLLINGYEFYEEKSAESSYRDDNTHTQWQLVNTHAASVLYRKNYDPALFGIRAEPMVRHTNAEGQQSTPKALSEQFNAELSRYSNITKEKVSQAMREAYAGDEATIKKLEDHRSANKRARKYQKAESKLKKLKTKSESFSKKYKLWTEQNDGGQAVRYKPGFAEMKKAFEIIDLSRDYKLDIVSATAVSKNQEENAAWAVKYDCLCAKIGYLNSILASVISSRYSEAEKNKIRDLIDGFGKERKKMFAEQEKRTKKEGKEKRDAYLAFAKTNFPKEYEQAYKDIKSPEKMASKSVAGKYGTYYITTYSKFGSIKSGVYNILRSEYGDEIEKKMNPQGRKRYEVPMEKKEEPKKAEVKKAGTKKAEVKKEAPKKAEVKKEAPKKAEVKKEALKKAEVKKAEAPAANPNEVIKVYQAAHQPKGSNQCWAYSMSLILQAKGIDVSPDDIVNETKVKFGTSMNVWDDAVIHKAFGKYMKGRSGDVFATAIKRELINQADYSKLTAKEKKKYTVPVIERLRSEVELAFRHGSAVEMLAPGEAHYITVVGMDDKKLYYKDSSASKGSDHIYDKDLEAYAENLYCSPEYQLELCWISDGKTKVEPSADSDGKPVVRKKIG